MVKKVYIQIGSDGMPVAPCGFALWEGSRFLGLNPEGFRVEHLPYLQITKETLVHGWVKTVHDALAMINVPTPAAIDYPVELAQFLNRNIKLTTLGQVHSDFVASEQEQGGPAPVFIKPYQHKLFTGHTIERFSHLAETSNFPPDTQVWRSDVIDIKTEWRCFVKDRCLLDVRKYTGNTWSTPDKNAVIQMISAYRHAPAGYALDVGIDETGKTVLVEVNDGYALGTYGFDGLNYAELVIARWEEIVNFAI